MSVTLANLEKKSNEEIMSLDTAMVSSPQGPSKRTRQSMRSKIVDALELPVSATIDIIQNTIEVGKEVENSIKELL